MNLIFRMLWVIGRAFFLPRMERDGLASTLNLRVLPNDIDINFHMNNGRYLTICDLNRVDVFARTGLLKAMFRRNWIPVIAEHTMTYKKPLNLFQPYQVSLEVLHWDEKYFYMAHRFLVGDRVMAEGTSKGCVYERGVGVVAPERALAAVEADRKA
ncbi:thioesterase family protein [Ferrigenium sp. UT5]|uniref:thioesterase family protein n=1 Tax=Ferrigenium sp. UT5 TaxID=3242105 RepID=UPI0035531127